RQLGDRAGTGHLRAPAQRVHLAERDRRGEVGALRRVQYAGTAPVRLAVDVRSSTRLPGPARAVARPGAGTDSGGAAGADERRARLGDGAPGRVDSARGATGG